jgi:phage-related protein
MGFTPVLLFAETNAECPFFRWMDSLPPAAQAKCIIRIERLEEARAASSDAGGSRAGDGICQLLFRSDATEYAILYFLHNQQAVIVHGCVVSSRLAKGDLALSVERRVLFCDQPSRHTYREDEQKHGN